MTITTRQRPIRGRGQDRKHSLLQSTDSLAWVTDLGPRDPGKPDGRTAAAKAMKGATGTTTAAHKLGPKANQGIINAGLRALDRTARPCRKWVKTEFKVKSFTGRVWEVPSWRTPNSRAFGSESDQGTSNSHSKGNSSSNVGSDKSPAVNPSNQASSPVNGISTPA